MRFRFSYLLSAAVLLLMPCKASAQYYRNSLGVRVGNMIAADYKYAFSGRSAVDVTLGVVNPFVPQYQFLLLSGAWHFNILTGTPGLMPYIGAGLSSGVQFGGENLSERRNIAYFMSADVPLGLEYIFRRYPLVFSIEWSPKLQFINTLKFIPHSISAGFRFRF